MRRGLRRARIASSAASATRLPSRLLRLAANTALAGLSGLPAMAADAPLLSTERINESQGLVGVSVFVALVIFSSSTALLHLTGRRRWTQRETLLVNDLTQTRARLDRANMFLSAEPQIVVAWGSASSDPDIEGDLTLVTDAPVPRRVLGFGSWLPPEPAQELERCVERLRTRGEGFRLALVSTTGRHLETEGRAVGGRAVMRIRDVSGDRLELTRLHERHGKLLTDLEGMRGMLDSVDSPAWMRDPAGRLNWVNAAYVRAVEARDARQVLSQGIEFLDRGARDAAEDVRQRGEIWRARVPAVVGGERHLMDVREVPSPGGSAGVAMDLSELETLRGDLRRQHDAHARTLDQLTTAVAIFDGSKRLVFYNAAYRQIWSLDTAFLDQNPTDSEILDRLRADHRLQEQTDYRAWKSQLHAAYQSNDTAEQVWYLPGGRTLRVVINPNPEGGVTYLYDDVTERYHLESRYNALIRVQGETLDTLKEGVAVFGADGRLKLVNTAFADMWGLPSTTLPKEPHFDEVSGFCAALVADPSVWTQFREAVVGLHDSRTGFATQLQLSDGRVLDGAVAPLPDGATLVTFTDVSASVNVERALKERNQALVDAEKLRNDFVHHVSYELRSPLTNIIGFGQLLVDGAIGTLNDKQREYTGYIMRSSGALLAIITDILDLATIDTGAMELSIGEVDVEATMRSAADGLRDRLEESAIQLHIVKMDDVGAFRADAKRVRQVLFNLLSNAVGFSAPGQSVTMAAMRRGDDIVFKVSDEGRGIPPEVLDQVFKRFESHTVGSRHRGVGLGLSIVRSFVELHGGNVDIQSAPGEGTTVTCVFPSAGAAIQPAAHVGAERTRHGG